MDIPINAAVQCSDGPAGRSTYVVVNPITEQVSHIVVKERHPPHAERLVQIKWVEATTPEQIRLSCSCDKLAQMRPFVETEFIRIRALLLEATSYAYYGDDEVMSLPYAKLDLPHGSEETESEGLMRQRPKAVPPGELAFRRGARVQATDGRVGRVDEFVVDPESKQITHVTLRQGHLWGEKEISIPVSEIERMAEDTVHLKLDRRQIAALPAVKVRRMWQ